MTKPDLENIHPFYKGYVEHVKDLDVFDALKTSGSMTQSLVRTLSESQGDFQYQPGKWTIKELLCHMLDVERIFAYRALRFGRNDKTNLPGFEENDYAPEANASNRKILHLANEMERLRLTTIDLYASFTPDMLNRVGKANNAEMSVLNLGYVIAGHETHHRKILLERYLKE
jgi:uncharacterized damage-inducible protein DinB